MIKQNDGKLTKNEDKDIAGEIFMNQDREEKLEDLDGDSNVYIYTCKHFNILKHMTNSMHHSYHEKL